MLLLASFPCMEATSAYVNILTHHGPFLEALSRDISNHSFDCLLRLNSNMAANLVNVLSIADFEKSLRNSPLVRHKPSMRYWWA